MIKVYQLLAHGRWFSPVTPASSTKTGRHDIAEILLKVALSTKKNQSINQIDTNKPLQKAFSMQLVHQKYYTGKDIRSTGIKTS
jgi:hypothetical protein